MPRGYLAFHLNLAFSSIPAEARPDVIRNCYWPLLSLAEELDVPVGVELTGWTLREICDLDPAWVARFRRLLQSGRCELIGSGWAQIIGPLVPYEANRWNQALGLRAYQRVLGVVPRIALVNEMAFSTGMIDVYAEAGYQGIIMDRDNVRLALNFEQQPLTATPTHARGSGQASLPVLWADSVLFQRFQRVIHGDISVSEYLSYVEQRAERDGLPLPIYCNDAEVFDHRPGRFDAESTLHPDGEWARMLQVCRRLTEGLSMEWVSPGVALELQGANGAQHAAHLSSISHPIPVKKQAKYNVNRWAVTGRDDLWLNSTCHGICGGLLARGDESPESWAELCELWASDLRTHITDARWADAVRWASALRAGSVGDQPGGRHLSSPSGFATPEYELEVTRDDEGLLWTVKTASVHLVLNVRRGLTINSLAFRSHEFSPIIGTLPQGYFPTIELGADFYSGGVLVELPGDRQRLTDLERVTPVVETQGEEIVLTAVIGVGAAMLRKSVAIDLGRERVRLSYDFGEWERPLGVVRVGILTLLPEAFELPLTLGCSNGGRRPESFVLDREVDHGMPSSALVSSKSAFGATGGTLSVGDPGGRGFSVRWNPAACAAVPMLKHQRSGDKYLTRVSFSLCELDDTSRAGGRLMPFSCDLESVPRLVDVDVTALPDGAE